jgi:hypothetical protein
MTLEELNRGLYLDLLKRCLVNTLYDVEPTARTTDGRLIPTEQLHLEGGRSWLTPAHTMIGMKRLTNVQVCLQAALESNVPGDAIETGVWRGGATIMMRGVLKAYGVTDRRVWVADSFEGLPPPNPLQYPADRGLDLSSIRQLAVPLHEVKGNFARYGLLDEQVCFLKGWFSDTLSNAPIEKLALLRLDGDLYESTMDSLTALYPKVSPGGFVIIDDYGAIPACRAAVHDYLDRHGLSAEIEAVDWTGVYWRRQ